MSAILAILMALRGLGIPCEVAPMSISAYTDIGWTASGAWTEHGMAACGPSFPFGTAFIVGGQTYICTDRGGLVTDGHIDIWWSGSEESALQFGRKTLPVIVVGGEK